MRYESHLIEGRFLNRYKRFFAKVELSENGTRKSIVAHVANTGSLRGVCEVPNPCRVAFHDNPKRKLKYSLEQIQIGTACVGVNTHLANDLVAEAFEMKLFKHWRHLVGMQREFKISDKTRLDFRFEDARGGYHFVEVKSVSMAAREHKNPQQKAITIAQFPDSPTVRGQKHLEELMALVQLGHSAEIFFVVQRTDAEAFSPAEQIDVKYAELLRSAHKMGVRVSAFAVNFSAEAAALLSTPLKILL